MPRPAPRSCLYAGGGGRNRSQKEGLFLQLFINPRFHSLPTTQNSPALQVLPSKSIQVALGAGSLPSSECPGPRLGGQHGGRTEK